MHKGRNRRVAVIVGAVALAVASPELAAAKSDPLAQAQAQVAAAKQAANAAAARYAQAETRYESLSDDVDALDRELALTEAATERYRAVAQQRAVVAYRSGRMNTSVETGDALDAVARRVLLERLNALDADAASRFAALDTDLRAQREARQRRRDEQRHALASLMAQRKQLDAKLATSVKAQQALATRVKSARRASGNNAGGRIVVNPGGRAWLCPVAGAAFTDDWGQRRSGGRHHQGTDLFAPRGAPNVAVVSGVVSDNSGGLGGTAVILQGDDGIQYYYAHLSQIVGPGRRVQQGELIGRTGNTGNAAGGPTHTHFEIRRGGTRVNPYPTLRAAC